MIKYIDIIWNNYIKQANTHLDQNVDLEGLSYKVLEYMWCISDLNLCTCTDIARRLSLSKPTVSAMVDRMANMGLIERVSNQTDKRCYYIKLSEVGDDLISKEAAFYEEYFEGLNKYLNNEERECFVTLLDKITQGINNENI